MNQRKTYYKEHIYKYKKQNYRISHAKTRKVSELSKFYKDRDIQV